MRADHPAEPDPAFASAAHAGARATGRRGGLFRVVRAVLILPLAYYALCVAGLVYLRFFPPVITMVQAQRAIERVAEGERPVREYRWHPIGTLSRHVPRAVVAAEDSRFYHHRGFDWVELRRARERAAARGEPMRGASTLTHQLIKNLYFTTHRNPARKLYEWALTLPAEWILGKDRIVELYVNVVEFGPGVFGAEAAARHHYGIPAAEVSRRQAAGLAAVLLAPLRRRPQRMAGYTSVILERMGQMGW